MRMRPLFFVRIGGLEPPRLSPLDPKSSAATNYAISASVLFHCAARLHRLSWLHQRQFAIGILSHQHHAV